MAKRKFNFKFFLLFFGVTAITFILAGVFYYYQIVLAPERNFRTGTQYMASGDFDKAASYFGRSVSKKPTNMAYLNALQDALLKIVPKSESAANENYSKLMSVKLSKTRAAAQDANVWVEAMESVRDRNELFGGDMVWREFSATAMQMEKALPLDNPGQALAQFWKLQGLNERYTALTPEERDTLDKDFPVIVKLLPNNERVWLAYLEYLLVKADALERGNQKNMALDTYRQFDAAIVECKKLNPQSIAAPILLVQRLEGMKFRNEPGVKQADLNAAFQAIMDQAPRLAQDRKLTLAAAGAIFQGRSFEANNKGMELLENRLKAFPNDAVTQRIYLNIARGMSNGIGRETAMTVFEQPNLPTSVEALSQQGAREAAADLLYTIAFEDWRKAKDETDKKAKLELVHQMRDKALQFFKSQALSLMAEDIEARTALADGNANDAAARFDALLKKIPDPTQEMYFYAGFANILRNQPGTALALVNRGLERYPNFPPLLNLSVRLSGGMGRTEDARKALQKLIELNPDDADAKASLALIGDGTKTDTEVAVSRSSNAMTVEIGKAERLMMKKDFDGAIALLAKQLVANPKEVRLYEALCQINIVKNDIPTAQSFIEKGLALDPKNAYFLQMKAITSSEDPIERIVSSIRLMYPDQKDQALQMYQALSGAMFKMRQATAAMKPEQVNAAMKEQMDHCAKLLGPALEAALAADPKNIGVLEIAATDAADQKDFTAFDKYVAAIAATGDLGLAATIQSRVLISQDKLAEAVSVLQDARKKGDQNPIMLRQLGMLYERMGNIDPAIELIRESYDRRPNDATTARLYAELLQRSGDRQKALKILQQAARTSPDDNDLMLSWLDLEGQIGDRSGAFGLRKRLYKERPALAKNSLALARMLLETPSDPNLMLDNNGAQKFTEQDMRDAATPKMQQQLAAAAKANLDMGFEIIKFLQEAAPGDTELSLINARALKKYGTEKEGEAAMRRDIARLDAAKLKSLELWVGLGVYLDESAKPEEARLAFDEARKQQDPKIMSADVRISDYWFSRGQWKNARDSLENVVQADTTSDAATWMRLSEICSRLRDFDASEKYLLKAATQNAPKETLATIELLRAANLEGQGELAVMKGDIATAEKQFAQERVVLLHATEMLPNSAQGWISLSDFERKMYQRTHDPKLIQAAEEAANRATDISMGYWPSIQNKERVLVEQGKESEAIAMVEKFLSLSPQNVDARRDLIQLLYRTNSLQRAVDLAQDGSRMNPRDASWQTMIGTLQLQKKDFVKATAAFDAAFVIQPELEQLLNSVNQRLRGDKKDWEGALKLLRANAKLVAVSPKAQILLAVALVNSGQRESGLTAMRTGYKTIADGIASGMLSPDEWGMWYSGLGQCFDKKPQEAEVFLKSVVGKLELSYWNCNGLSALYSDLGSPGTLQSIQWLEQAAKLAKSAGGTDANQLEAIALLQIGNLYYKENEFSKSTEYFEKALLLIPNNASAMNNAAYLIAKSGSNSTRAVELARKAVELNPNTDDFLDTLGFALLKDGKPAEAMEPLQKAIVLTQKPGSMMHLAEVFIQLKRPADAKEYLEKAKAKSPTSEQLTEIKTLESKLN